MAISKKRIAFWTLAVAFGVAISLPLGANAEQPPQPKPVPSYVQANVNQFRFTQIPDPSTKGETSVIRFVDYELRKVCYIQKMYVYHGGGPAISCLPL